jgi:hypothetical protein
MGLRLAGELIRIHVTEEMRHAIEGALKDRLRRVEHAETLRGSVEKKAALRREALLLHACIKETMEAGT